MKRPSACRTRSASSNTPASFGNLAFRYVLMSDSASSIGTFWSQHTASDVKDSQRVTTSGSGRLVTRNLKPLRSNSSITVSSSCRNADPPPSLISSRASITMRYGGNCGLRVDCCQGPIRRSLNWVGTS